MVTFAPPIFHTIYPLFHRDNRFFVDEDMVLVVSAKLSGLRDNHV